MPIRRVPVARCLSWLGESLDMTGKRPGAALGAVMLALTAAFVLLLAAVLLIAPFMDGSPTSSLRAMSVLVLLLLALQPVLFGGVLAVLHRIERGEPVSAAGVFVGFSGGRFLPLASLGLIQVVAFAINFLALDWLGGDGYLSRYWAYFEALQPGQGLDPNAIPQPENAGLLSLVNLIVGFLVLALLSFSVPQVLLAGRTPGSAVREALVATLVNLPALLSTSAVALLGILVATLVFGLLMALVGLVGKAVAPVLGALLGFALIVLAMLLAVAMLAGVAYLAWRDVFEPDADRSSPAGDEVSAEF